MATPDIPDDLESLSPAWLTHALQQAGTLKNAHITSLTAEPVGVGIGVIGQLFRLQLAYDRIEDGAPLSLVVKLPSADPQTRIRYWRLAKGNIYERESRFYREIAANLPLPTPHCHYSAYDYPRKKFILLLEDMAATQPGDQVAGSLLDVPDAAARILSMLDDLEYGKVVSLAKELKAHFSSFADSSASDASADG